MPELGPYSLNVAREHKIELLMDIKVAMVDPEMVPPILGQV